MKNYIDVVLKTSLPHHPAVTPWPQSHNIDRLYIQMLIKGPSSASGPQNKKQVACCLPSPENQHLHPPTTTGCGNVVGAGTGWAQGTKEPAAGTLETDGKNMVISGGGDQAPMMKGSKTPSWHSKSKHLGYFAVRHHWHFASYIILSRSEREKQSDLWEMVGVRVNICTACYVPWKKCATQVN